MSFPWIIAAVAIVIFKWNDRFYCVWRFHCCCTHATKDTLVEVFTMYSNKACPGNKAPCNKRDYGVSVVYVVAYAFVLFSFLQLHCWIPCQLWPTWAGRLTQMRGWVCSTSDYTNTPNGIQMIAIVSMCLFSPFSVQQNRTPNWKQEQRRKLFLDSAGLLCSLNRDSAGGIYKLFPLHWNRCAAEDCISYRLWF